MYTIGIFDLTLPETGVGGSNPFGEKAVVAFRKSPNLLVTIAAATGEPLEVWFQTKPASAKKTRSRGGEPNAARALSP